MRFLFVALVIQVALSACGKLDLGAGGQLDYTRRWKDRYLCQPSTAEARESLETCEVRFLTGGGMMVRVRDRHFKGLTFEALLSTRTETDRAFSATCESLSGSDGFTPVYQRAAGEAGRFTDEAKRPAFQKFLRNSALLRDALPRAIVECQTKAIPFGVKEKTLTARDESTAGFQFNEAVAE